MTWIIFSKIFICILFTSGVSSKYFPPSIDFGVATSAYQIEGAWNVDGRGESIWDNFTHTIPSPIANGDTGDVACDSYDKYEEDVRLIAALGVKYYRFSISWSRVLPTGYSNDINLKGLEYYKNLTLQIKKFGMIPVVTLYHWDLPQRLREDGIDWINIDLVQHFVNYSRIVIEHLPEVGIWLTINEPKQVCHYSYGNGRFAPGIKSSGLLEYQCAYVLLKTHAAVYHMYKEEFPNYEAKMAIAPDCQWVKPLTDKPADIAAAYRQLEFWCGLYYQPIFSGDWPYEVKTRIALRSIMEHYNQSRLPQFDQQEIEYIRGTSDFIAVNHYVTLLVSDVDEGPDDVTSFENDMRTNWTFYPSVNQGANGFTVNPWGIRKVINWLHEQYGKQDILITEVGISDNGTSLNDDFRISFYTGMYCNILEAVETDNINVFGVIAWSYIDNFEWLDGYTMHFGMYHIDFSDADRKRVPKKSVEFFQNLTTKRYLNCEDEL
ncbi:lactase/phlorizin hydrolase-like [Diorhabda sublineata]|uniref:lactase/phlorizin hydrolase-like n=1 Tax=Diorhabda sublineata TaxID=1163346 RepID=UPI0024E09D60|nr:lactase/phlorizin hydrolase-like [Diorhabda sublineata]